MFRGAEETERGVVVKEQWVFSGDKVTFTWKSIYKTDLRTHSAKGTVVDIGYAPHPITGNIESGFALGRRGRDPEGFAESMIEEITFKTAHELHVRDRKFPADFKLKPIFGDGAIVSVLPENHLVRQRHV